MVRKTLAKLFRRRPKDDTRVFWLRDKQSKPVACVANSIKDNEMHYAVSTHNPCDRFDRTRGREIATGRLQTGHVSWFSLPNDITGRKIKRLLMAHIVLNPDVPHRARRCADIWLKACTECKNPA